MKRLFLLIVIIGVAVSVSAKTLIAYYSFTNNSRIIATELQKQIDADILEIEPLEENVNYNDYSIGLAMMNLIKAHPDDPASYPEIKTTISNLEDYDTVLIVAPLWWNAMAAPLQTFFFKYGGQMNGKNIGLIVSSGESPISGVVADVRRLIPGGKLLEPSLWIIRDKTSLCAELIEKWLQDIHYFDIASIESIVNNKVQIVKFSAYLNQIDVLIPFDLVKIFDIKGSLIATSSSTPLSTNGYSPGLYLVSVNHNRQNITSKLVIK